MGLAKRGDPRVRDAIEEELRNGGVIRFAIEAIGITKDPRWVPWMEEMVRDLTKTMELCRGEGVKSDEDEG